MNRLSFFFSFCAFLLSSNMSLGLIRECSSIQETLSEATPDTLVVLDIDNTLIRPCQYLGSEEWFQFYLKQQTELSHNNEEALLQTLDLLHSIYAVTKVQLMEPKTADVVRQLQTHERKVMGLTNRGPMAAHMTIQHLASVGIDLSLAAPSKASFPLIDLSETLYHQGILFSNGKSKRQALLGFFRQLGWQPQRIVYINDQRRYLEELSFFEDKGVSFVGLRFSGSDEYSRKFNPSLCTIELEAFRGLLSDNTAIKTLQEQCSQTATKL